MADPWNAAIDRAQTLTLTASEAERRIARALWHLCDDWHGKEHHDAARAVAALLGQPDPGPKALNKKVPRG